MPHPLANVAIGKQRNAALTGSNIEFMSVKDRNPMYPMYLFKKF